MYIDFGLYILFTLPLMLMDFSSMNFFVSIVSVHIAAMTKKHNIILDENKIVRDELKEDTLYLEKYNEQLKIDGRKIYKLPYLQRETGLQESFMIQ